MVLCYLKFRSSQRRDEVNVESQYTIETNEYSNTHRMLDLNERIVNEVSGQDKQDRFAMHYLSTYLLPTRPLPATTTSPRRR